jgi:hypothetical protein
VDLYHEFVLLFRRTAFKNTLDDAAPVCVSTQGADLTLKKIHDKRNTHLWDQKDYLLDHMVAILILYDAHNLGLELLNDFLLLVDQYMLQSLPPCKPESQ